MVKQRKTSKALMAEYTLNINIISILLVSIWVLMINLKLNIQLPNSKLDYKTYTEFYHYGNDCFEYDVKSYEKYDDLNKIDAYRIKIVRSTTGAMSFYFLLLHTVLH